MRYSNLALAALFVIAASAAQAQNLVTNPGFETGDFTGYTVNAGATGVSATGGPGGYAPFDGTYYAFLGNVGGLGTISQDIATTPGQDYLVSYYLASNGTTPNEFVTSFGGTTLFDQTDIAPQPYTLYSL